MGHHLVYPIIFHLFFWEVQPESAQVWLRIDDFVQLFDTVYECRLATGRRLGLHCMGHLWLQQHKWRFHQISLDLEFISSCFFSWIFTTGTKQQIRFLEASRSLKKRKRDLSQGEEIGSCYLVYIVSLFND